MSENYYVVLAGGIGAAKLIEGLAQVINPELLKIIVNTGDDIELFGLKICPDLDIITYTLANLVDKEKGWGFKDETFNCLNILKNYYDTGWFNAGDKDLATHIYRTDLFKQGFNKAEITNLICQNLGVKSHLIPMSNEPVETFITTPSGTMHFEEYFIKHQCKPEVLRIAAERTWNLLRIMNKKEGFNRNDDKLPQEWFRPLKFGVNQLEFKDFFGETNITKNIANQLLDDYYNERGWNKNGNPTEIKIKELNLEKFN